MCVISDDPKVNRNKPPCSCSLKTGFLKMIFVLERSKGRKKNVIWVM